MVSMARRNAAPSGAEGVVWDLADLYGGLEDPRIEADLAAAQRRAKSLGERYRGRVASLDAKALADLLGAYEAVVDVAARIGAYAYLEFSTNTEDPKRGALLQKVTERGSLLEQELLFVELEWSKAGDDSAASVMADPAVGRYRHWLEVERRLRPYLLSEPEEKILAEKSVTGRSAWGRFFDELHGAMRYDLDGASVPQQVILDRLHDADREARRKAASEFTRGLRQQSRLTAYVFNAILADKASDDRLRGYPSWISARNLSNQTDDRTVATLVSAVQGRYGTVARYYRLKKRLLGVEELFDYDRYAPLPSSEVRVEWADAKSIVLDAFARFHPEMRRIASLFFDRRWIHAAITPGKSGGAYSHSVAPSAHPYVFLNYNGTPRDVMTLAHELGHGVHQYLARERGLLESGTPLTTAETASVFGEMLVFRSLLERSPDRESMLALLLSKIEDSFATVFRQVAMNRFEDAVHTARRSSGELDVAAFSARWRETQAAMFGSSLTLTEDYGIWWSYIPHFLHTPGYVYAYAFGELLVLALYARFSSGAPGFAERYLEMLAKGGSAWPHELVAPLGVDLREEGFWDAGLAMLDDLVGQAEELAGRD
jgi:oligoendopeptidase F